MTAERSIVTANAGSGKTYLLANRLIRWMLDHARRDPHGCCGADAILAVTFTRKAAGEILDRVLRHLARGASSEGARTEFGSPYMIGEATQAEYQAVLAQVIDQLDRLSIGTLDSYFSRIAKVFAPEMGLPLQWTIASTDQDADQRARALSSLLEEQPDAVWTLVRMATGGAPKAMLSDALLAALHVPARLHDLCDQHRVGDAPWDALSQDSVTLFPKAALLDGDALTAATAALATAPLPVTAKGTPNKTWGKEHDSLLRQTAAGDWRGVLTRGYAIAISSGKAYSKVAPDPALHAAVSTVFHHALAVEAQVIKHRIRACRELSRGFRDRVASIRQAEGRYSFEAIASAIARAHQLDGDGMQALRYRLDCAIQDLAIDECQDTSPDQYTAIAPFMDEIFAADAQRRFLMVGDPKQSIYGWRDGTPALIGRVTRDRADGLEADVALADSQRSSPAIMQLVNEVFGPSQGQELGARLRALDDSPGIASEHMAALQAAGITVPTEVGLHPVDRVMRDWTFVPHHSAARLHDRPAVLAAWPATDLEEWAATAARVATSITHARPHATVGVLVHTNKQVAAVVHALRQRGVSASDEGRASLMDAMAVVTLMAFLRVAEQPLDRIALFVATRPAVRSALASVIDVPAFDDPHAADALGRTMRRALHERGLVAWLNDAVHALNPLCVERDRMRMQQVIALAAAAPAEMVARPEQFVRLVGATGSSTCSGDQIRVMTIHSSKGFEFDEVVLPTLDTPMDQVKAGPGEWAVVTDGPGGAPLAIGPVVGEQLVQRSTLLSALHSEARVRRLFDGLSAFYVAITRAKSGIHFVCRAPTKADAAKLSPLWLLRRSVDGFEAKYTAAFTANPPSDQPFWGNDANSLQLAVLDRAPDAIGDAGERRTLPTLEFEGDAHGPPARMSVRFPVASDAAAMRRGTLVHAILRQVRWASDGLSDDALLAAHALVHAELQSPIGATEWSEAIDAARSALASPAAAALVHPADDLAWTVYGELPFLVRSTNASRRSGRMDRVAFGVQGERVERVWVVDFKTGSQGDSKDDVLRHYGEQMSDYRSAAAELAGVSEDRVRVTLAMVDRGDTIEA